MRVILYALALVLIVLFLALPLIIGWLLADWRDNGWCLFIVPLIGYSLMIGGRLVYDENDLSGTAEVVGVEIVPAHNESRVRTTPIIVGGKTTIMTTPTNEYKAEEYTIHARQLRKSGFKRFHLIVDEEEYESIELGQEINLADYERVD